MSLPDINLGDDQELPDNQKQMQQPWEEVYNDIDPRPSNIIQHNGVETSLSELEALFSWIDPDDVDSINQLAAKAEAMSAGITVDASWKYWEMSTPPPEPNVTYLPPQSGEVDPTTDTVVP